MLKSVLQLSPELHIIIEKAHRALTAKPQNPEAATRSLVVRFLDFSVKETILRQAWEQKKVMYEGKQIYFDYDFSPELQKKRALVRDKVKQLKMKNNIRAKCVFPAQLRLFMEEEDSRLIQSGMCKPTLFNLLVMFSFVSVLFVLRLLMGYIVIFCNDSFYSDYVRFKKGL